MKNPLLSLGACILLTACSSTPQRQSENVNYEPVSEPVNNYTLPEEVIVPEEEKTYDSHSKEYIVQRVNDIYEYVLKCKNSNCDIGPDKKYCTIEWNRLLHEVDSLSTDYPYWDDDYWIMGQDISEDLSFNNVHVLYLDGDTASASVTIHNFGDTKVTLSLVYERDDWYIDNIISYHYYNGERSENDRKTGMIEFINEEEQKKEH